MSKKHKPTEVEIETRIDNINPQTGEVDSGTTITDTVDLDEVVIVPAPEAVEPDESITDLQADYDGLLAQVQQAVKDGHDLERSLLVDVKKQVKIHAGDVEALKARKREASMKLEAAKLKAQNQAEYFAATEGVT